MDIHNPLKDKISQSSFYQFTITRPVAILMVVIGVVVFGYISYQQLPLNLMPDMTYPSLTVRTEYIGTAPEEIETTISRPVEQALGVVDNLVSISSVSKADQSDVILEFTWDTNMDKATADIREKLDQVFLPEDAERPLILRYDPSLDPILRLGLYGESSLTYLRYIAEEELKRALETIDGVAAVKVKGGLEEEIRVELNEQKLTLIGMNIRMVEERLMQENVNLAGGNLKEGQTEYLVRTLNEFKSTEEIANVIIGRFNNVDIKVQDVGRVYRTSKEREIITRINSKESVEIEIFKEADANIVSVAERVKNRLYGTVAQQEFVAKMKAEQEGSTQPAKKDQKKNNPPGGEFMAGMMTNFLAYSLPEGIHIETLTDQSIFIKNSIDEVKSTAIVGGILAVIVLFVFLRRLGPTVIIGLSIPISIIATFAPLRMFDVSLNIMSLGGLALSIGMLVDNSIVVLENIARRRDEGDDLLTATIRGVSEGGGAVIASTLTTIAVFFPIVFVEGVAGQVFGDMALTVVFSLLASLAVALFLIPMLSSRQAGQMSVAAGSTTFNTDFILRFKNREEVDLLLSETNRSALAEKTSAVLRQLLRTLYYFFQKIGLVLVALVAGFLKKISLIGLTLLIPVIAVVMIVLKKRGWGDFFLRYSASGIRFLPFIESVWSEYVVFKTENILFADFGKIRSSFSGKSLIGKLWVTLLALLKSPVFLIKYLVSSIFEILFRLIHALILLAGIAITFLAMSARLLFTPFTRLAVVTFEWFYGFLERRYPVWLQKSLDNKGLVLGSVLLIFLFSILVVLPRLGSELIPEVHQGEFNVELTLPVGTPVEQTDERITEIQERIRGIENVAHVASVAGFDRTATSEAEEGEHTAKLTVTLVSSEQTFLHLMSAAITGQNLAALEERTIAGIRTMLREYPGIEANIARPALFSFKTPVEIHLKGYNLFQLQHYTNLLVERIAKIPGLVDVKSNLRRGNPEIQIYYDRDLLAHHGLNVMQVAAIVRNKVRGNVATEFKEEDRQIDILVRLREEDKQSIDDLQRLIINPGAARPIQLQSVARIRINEGPSEIRRVDQQRTALISANVGPGANLKDLNEKIYQELLALNLPNDFTYDLAGQNKEMETSQNSLILALALAIFLVYIVMASQFESLIHPFVIIFTIPLAILGVILFLYLFKIPLSIVVFLGMIMLAGIVVNNAIILIDFINHLRAEGVARLEAVLQAGKVRLRPILMTTLTTVLGLLPMALGLGDGAEIRTPMAITVIVGLIISTTLTLVVIPTMYLLVTRD